MEEEVACRVIQRNVRIRNRKREIHFRIGSILLRRRVCAFRTFLLVDEMLDDNIEYLVRIFDSRSKRLFFPTLDDMFVHFNSIDCIDD